jgi:SagB-type dehydrogenase family enzyme
VTTVSFKRSPHIVSYWSRGDLVFHNFATGRRIVGNALTIGLLDYFTEWRAVGPLLVGTTLPRSNVRKALRALVRASMLQQSNRRLPAAERAMSEWAEWNPAAGFFHFSTKDVPYRPGQRTNQQFLLKRLRSKPLPGQTKSYSSTKQSIRLPPVPSLGPLSEALLARRTWRRFGPNGVRAAAASALLGLTFGAQEFLDLGAAGKAMLRTSPSAGACNPIEAYVVVRRVSRIPPGIYYYAPQDHRLVRINKISRGTIARHLAGQSWYGAAAMIVLMTASFSRTQWKYPFARAYRTVLLEAGHFCQTFCLIATELGLAPFCSAALADSAIERDLGIDGVTESVLYACGVGSRPPDVTSAPWPEETSNGAVVP